MRGPALTEGPSSGALGQPAATDGASPASTVTLLSERKSSELWRRRAQLPTPPSTGIVKPPVTTSGDGFASDCQHYHAVMCVLAALVTLGKRPNSGM